MKLREFKNIITDSGRDIQERLFILVSVIALMALFLTFLLGIVVGESKGDLFVLGGGFFLCSSIIFFSVRRNRIRLGSNLLAFLIVFAVLPLTFFAGGGIYGGSPLWFVFCILFISLILSGKIRIFYIISSIAVAISCYYAAYQNPALVSAHTTNTAYQDSLVSLILVSIMVSLLVGFEIQLYRIESERSEKQREEIKKLNKAQTHFFSSMSHEIRTPINTIIGLNEMILREEISDEVAVDAMNIQSASRMLLHLINDILDMSKIESGKMQITPVVYNTGDMFSEIVGMLWIRAKEKGLSFHIEIDPSLPAELIGDEVRIKQVLINVLTNAIKYTNHGSVTLSVQCEKQGNHRAVVTYSVTDTGMGIRKENLPYLFTAFRRMDEDKNRYIEGTGLGLSIVKQFVDMMDGAVSVNSVYTQGSTFIIKLPQEISDEREIGELNMEKRHSMNRRKEYRRSFEAPEARILVVDDNRANLLVVTKLLRDTKIQIDTAESGAQALMKTLESKYHLIFMDHMMPEMDGITCMHKIHEQTGGLSKEAKIIALTANAGSDNRTLYINEGFDGYLLKPVSGEELERELLRRLPKSLVRIETTEDILDENELDLTAHKKRIPLLITTESVSDLPKKMLKSKNIPVLSYHIFTEEGYFLDGVEMDSDGLLDYVAKKKKKAHSAPPEVRYYEAFFAGQLLRANNIIHISLAKGVNEAYRIAEEAAKTFDNVTVVDSGHLSSGMGLIALAANQLAAEGHTVSQILKELDHIKKEVHTSFVVDSLDYLVRAGRVSEMVRKFASAFLIHPVLVLKKSNMGVGKVYFGTRKRVWRKYIAFALANPGGIDKSLLFVTYVGLTAEELKEIEDEVKKRVIFDKIIFQKASSAISSNCGPGAFGLLFRT